MEIIEIEPFGFCGGVLTALNLVKQLRQAEPETPIYIWGPLVHNTLVVQALVGLKVQTLDASQDIAVELKQLPHGYVVTSAHGISEAIITAIKAAGFKHLDATCEIIKQMHYQIRQELQRNHEVVFFGTANHPELKAVLSLDAVHIHALTNEQDLNKLQLKDASPALFSQTTMVAATWQGLAEKLLRKYPKARLMSGVCQATTQRQQALQAMLPKLDGVVVIGDKTSNNGSNLAKIARDAGVIVAFINEAKQLNLQKFQALNKVAVVSATSTPKAIVQQIVAYLKTGQCPVIKEII